MESKRDKMIEAGWAAAGLVIGALMSGAFSVYVENMKRISDDVRYRAHLADEILDNASGAVAELVKQELLARSTSPSWDRVGDITPTKVANQIATHFPALSNLGLAFEKAAAKQHSSQNALMGANTKSNVDNESSSLGDVETSLENLRQALPKEVARLNNLETSWTPLRNAAP